MVKNFLVLITLVMSVFLSSCGKQPQVITGVKVESTQVDQELWVSFAADLNLGSMSFPSLTLPVVHPKTLESIGLVELGQALGSKNFLKFNLNFSAVSDLKTSIPKLPNGNSVPLIANNQSISIPLPNGGKIYLTLSEVATAIGIALPIKQFDEIGRKAPGVGFFPIVAIDQLVATAGLFTSTQSGQNGIALVADVSNYVRMQDIYVPAPVTVDQLALSYNQIKPSDKKVEIISKVLYDLNTRKTKLKLK
jgi:hypothetical protein